MISIGADFGGPELKGSGVEAALSKLSVATRKMRTERGDDWIINPIFIVPGTVSGPLTSDHVEYGKFSRKPPRLSLRVPVPSKLAQDANLMQFLVMQLRGCNAMAFEYFRQRKLDFPLREAEAFVTAVAEAIPTEV